MQLPKKWWAAGVCVAAVVAMVAVFVPSAPAATATKCPSDGTPAPGSTITGGIEVDGYCVLRHVTVHGSINVAATQESRFMNCDWNAVHLFGSTVDGGIVVNARSELLVGVDFSAPRQRLVYDSPAQRASERLVKLTDAPQSSRLDRECFVRLSNQPAVWVSQSPPGVYPIC